VSSSDLPSIRAINRQQDEVLADVWRECRRHPLHPASLYRVDVNPDVVAARPHNHSGRHVVGRLVERDLDRRKTRPDMIGPVDHPLELLALTQIVNECQGSGAIVTGTVNVVDMIGFNGLEP
jgi:hypothetical protein